MTKILKLNEAQEFVNRGVLEHNVEIGITNFKGEYFIDKIFQLNGDVRFLVTKLDESNSYNISYKQISIIAGQSIDDILEAYDMGENSIIEISYETDVMNDVVGKEEAELDGKDLDEGMRIILHNDKTEKMNNKILNVKYDDKGLLKLVANRGRPKKNS
jgi:hypothetical protein